jgi:hypothetical protein
MARIIKPKNLSATLIPKPPSSLIPVHSLQVCFALKTTHTYFMVSLENMAVEKSVRVKYDELVRDFCWYSLDGDS